MFTLPISPYYYYVFSCMYTAYLIVLPQLTWPCSHYVLDSIQTAYDNVI